MTRWSHENDYDGIIAVESARTGVSMPLIKAVISLESEFMAGATRAEAARPSLPPTSDFPSGGDMSIGLMQLLVRTARTLGYSGPVGAKAGLTGLFDPATNVRLGTTLLRDNVTAARIAGLGVDAAISAYNGGWRPSLGFGRPLANGQFANQAYVNVVFQRMAYFGASADEMTRTVSLASPQLPPVPTVPLPDVDTSAPDPTLVSDLLNSIASGGAPPAGAATSSTSTAGVLALLAAALGVVWLVTQYTDR